MVIDNESMEITKADLVNLCDIGKILGMPCMLEFDNALMKCAQAKDVFVCDYTAIVKICQTDLYKMYNDPTTSFQPKNFPEFTNVANTFCRITQNWVIDLNDGNEHYFALLDSRIWCILLLL